MTDEKDGPVHYQVSVTGRQAAAFFLVLLGALGLSFFFGMKTGAAARRGPDSVTALAAQSDIPVPTAVAGGDGGGRASPVPTEAPIGFEAAAIEPTRAPVEKAGPSAREESRVAVREEGGAAAGAPELVETAPHDAPAPAKETAAKTAAKTDEGPFWVQILVTTSAEKADDLAKKLKADGFRSHVSLVPGKRDHFRVRIGPYAHRAKAEEAVRKAEKAEKLKTKPIVVPGK